MNNENKLQIIEEYGGLINKYANIYYRNIKSNDVNKDDLRQEIILGLIKDLDSLDEEKGKSVFIQKSIERSCLKYVTTRNRLKRGSGLADDSLDREIDNAENVNLIDVIESDYNLEYDTINNLFIKDILEYANNTKGRGALILKLYGEGYTFQEIGYKLNISKQRANFIFMKIINKIRDEFKIEVM